MSDPAPPSAIKSMLLSMFVLCVVFVAELQRPVNAQAPPQPKAGAASAQLPNVDQVLERYVTALGGRAAIEKITSRVVKGRVEFPSESVVGEVEIAAKAPDKVRIRFSLPGFTVEEGFDGTVAWQSDTRGVVRTLRGELAANSRVDAQFYSDLRMAELFPQLKVAGTEVIDGEETYLLEAVPAQGSRRWFYFSVKTGLLVRYDADITEGSGAGRASMRLSGFKTIDGLQIATKMVQESKQLSWIIRVTEVRHNVPLEDSYFRKPKPESD